MATSAEMGISVEVTNRADYVMGVKNHYNTGMVSFPWYDKHVILGNREIFQWTLGQSDILGDQGADAPHICGAICLSHEAIVAHYKYEAATNYPIQSEQPAYIIRFEPEDGWFSTWADAEAWLLSGEA